MEPNEEEEEEVEEEEVDEEEEEDGDEEGEEDEEEGEEDEEVDEDDLQEIETAGITERSVSVLWTSAWQGKTDDVRRLLAEGAEDIEGKGGPTQCTPLYVAVLHGHLEAVQLLLEAGADVSAKVNDEHFHSLGRSPLHAACISDNQMVVGREAIAELLLDHRADASAKDSQGDAPLHFAAMNSHVEVVTLLLHHSAEVSSKNDDCHTPLHYGNSFPSLYSVGR